MKDESNRFNLNDECYFFYINNNGEFLALDDLLIIPQNIELLRGKIIYIDHKSDEMHIYIDGNNNIIDYFSMKDDFLYKTREEALLSIKDYINKL